MCGALPATGGTQHAGRAAGPFTRLIGGLLLVAMLLFAAIVVRLTMRGE